MKKRMSLVIALCLAVSAIPAEAAKKKQPRAPQETLHSALAKAYNSNPDLRAARAQLRAIDEQVPLAQSGFRPTISASVDGGLQEQGLRTGGAWGSDGSTPRGAALTLDQNIFNGFKSSNSVRAAKAQVRAGREVLRINEQDTLLLGVDAYMNVLRDTAILNLRRNNINLISEQVEQTRLRLEVGEVTRTDVAQAEARLARARSENAQAEASLSANIAAYTRVIGQAPQTLAAGQPLDKHLPKGLDEALSIALAQHPAILASVYGADVASIQIRIAQGDLLPTLGLTGTLSKRYETASAKELESASVVGRLSMPIYEGGAAYARTRAAQQTSEQRRLEVDSARERVRAVVIANWSLLDAARAQVRAAEAQVKAAEIALTGVREEAKVGQRTTLDVLNAQQELLDARTAQITAQRERVVASYRVLSSIGALSAERLGLNVDLYNPRDYSDKADGRWIGFE